MKMTTKTFVCPRCRAEFEAEISVAAARVPSNAAHCDDCRFKGLHGFLYAPIGLAAQICGMLYRFGRDMILIIRRKR